MAERSGELDDFGAGHPDVDELIGYVRGELSQRRARGIRAHAAACLDCGDQLAALILLREERLNAGDEAAPQATVMRFPVPARAPVRRWRRAGAAAAVLILALAWLAWPAQVAEQEALVAEGLVLPSLDFEATDSDVGQVMDAVDFLGMPFDAGVQVTGGGTEADRRLLAAALQVAGSGDLTAARTLLESYGERWDQAGTAALGYVLFLLEDPAAYAVLEMYVAEHPTQVWDANAETPEDLAFFFAARLRHAIGDDAGAREAVGWIEPRGDAGVAATAWLQETLGSAVRVGDSDVAQDAPH